jgi:S-adenosylmethionine-diacylglycerol 3-amino-3-carboxypropyl transferase
MNRPASFRFVRYASVWEDADVLCDALSPVAAGGRLFSIASAGDNALALLTLDPREVVAVDWSLPQLACLELRVAAFRELNWQQLLAFLGVLEDNERAVAYSRVRASLSQPTRDFWDARLEAIGRGIIHHGRFENYFRLFRRCVLPLIHSQRTIAELCAAKSLPEQRAFYASRWDNWRWRTVFSLFFSRFALGRLGRDPAFFEHVEGSVASRILERTRYALTELPVESNPYFCYIMTGNYSLAALPRYLREEHFASIRDRLTRLHWLQGDVEAADGVFDGYNLSDIFEYMTTEQARTCYGGLVARARSGTRLVYWNMLAPRACPKDEPRIRPLHAEAERLHAQDRAWFYSRLHVDEVVGGA